MRRRELDAYRRETAQLLDRIDRKVEGIERVTMIREPGSHLAAEAYDGLRRQVGQALAERNAHLHQLAQFDAARRAGATPEELERLVREWMGQARLKLELDASRVDAFEEVGDPHGQHVRVLRPAYVDDTNDRVVRSGVVERMQHPVPPEPPATEAASQPERQPVAPVTEVPVAEPVEVATTEPNGDAS